MVDYREILRLDKENYSQRQIEASTGISRHTVSDVLAAAKAAGIEWPLGEEVTNEDLRSILFPGKFLSQSEYLEPDYAMIHKELAKPGVTLTLLWNEYCRHCAEVGKRSYMSTQFGDKYRKWAKVTKATMRIQHKPGDVMEVDWAGNTLTIWDSVTGESSPAYLFVAVLPCSGYAYVEACSDMKLENWLLCHVHAYAYFGGVTRLLIPDNLKTGVTKNTRYETVLNRSYQELAEHYDTAVVPARVEHPRDKSHAEGTVRLASTWILAALRNEHFFSLSEAQEAVKDKLEEMNQKPFQAPKTGCRRSVYLEEERDFMKPLPAVPYELSTWMPNMSVSTDYLISDGRNKYSVPFDLIGEKVDVRLTRKTVEVFYHGNRIASHVRAGKPQREPIINRDHLTPEHRKYLNYNADDFTVWSREVGKNTEQVVRSFLTSGKEAEVGFKSCVSLMKLGERYGKRKLENACAELLTIASAPSIRLIASILKNGKQAKAPEEHHHDNEHGITRGAAYYARKDGDSE